MNTIEVLRAYAPEFVAMKLLADGTMMNEVLQVELIKLFDAYAQSLLANKALEEKREAALKVLNWFAYVDADRSRRVEMAHKYIKQLTLNETEGSGQ